jgi:predicted AAA+ superfamily ATPase
MNDTEMRRVLSRGCAWWRDPAGWEATDPDLTRIRGARLRYQPGSLDRIAPDGLYVLRGPRRVGKTVNIKLTIAKLIREQVNPRRILHYACDGLAPRELLQLVRVGRDQATAGISEPRYWFLDEITAVSGWATQLKWLRDNTDLRHDCVVLTGSSARDLIESLDQLAGRRGAASHPDRLLLPISFRTFCQQFQDGLPDPAPVRPQDLLLPTTDRVVAELEPWLDQLASLWEVYCQCGGFPEAVESQLVRSSIDEQTTNAAWGVVISAVNRSQLSDTQTLTLLHELSKRLSSRLNLSDLARDLHASDQKFVDRRLQDLTDNYLVWPCYQRGNNNLPLLRSQTKYYFTDPLFAHLASLRSNGILSPPDTSHLTEQQLGLHLIRAVADADPTTYADYAQVMYLVTATRKEVDFVGPALGSLGLESKYTDSGLESESVTLRAAVGQGVMASRATLGRSDKPSIAFLPASFIAFLLAS